MIDGITVLSQRMMKAPPDWISIVVVVSFIMCVVGGLIIIIGTFMDSDIICDIGGVIGGITLVIGFVFFLISFACNKPTGKYEYKVIIDDSVALQKVYTKYEVVDVEGMIYTIRDKEGDTVADD